MIRRLRIENFRCLRKVEINLEPMTVLVGANGSGKSSVFAALQDPGTFKLADRWAKHPGEVVSIHYEGQSGPIGTMVMPQDSGPAVTGSRPVSQILHLEVASLRQPNTLAEARQLTVNGQGLANVFSTLTRQLQAELVRNFCGLVPAFSDVQSRPQGSGSHRLIFQDKWRPKVWYEPTEVSDGSMLLFAFLILQHQDPQPDLIAIEEPERGLHPHLIGELVTVLRRLSTGDFGKKIQVLLATHSAELLEFVEPREVRFLSRSKDTGETLIEEAPADSPEWRQAFREYDDSLGQLWLSGGLGGVPGS